MFITTLSVKNNLLKFQKFSYKNYSSQGLIAPSSIKLIHLFDVSDVESFSADRLLCRCLAIAIFPTLSFFYDTFFVLVY